jgi:hypothetical protein
MKPTKQPRRTPRAIVLLAAGLPLLGVTVSLPLVSARPAFAQQEGLEAPKRRAWLPRSPCPKAPSGRRATNTSPSSPTR